MHAKQVCRIQYTSKQWSSPQQAALYGQAHSAQTHVDLAQQMQASYYTQMRMKQLQALSCIYGVKCGVHQ